MKGYKKKIDAIGRILGHYDNPDKPFVLNDVNLQDFHTKMRDYIDNYVYFNQDKNVVKASEVLAEILILILLTANKQGLREAFDDVINLVCDDIIEGTQEDEGNHRIPIVTQGNHKIINYWMSSRAQGGLDLPDSTGPVPGLQIG